VVAGVGAKVEAARATAGTTAKEAAAEGVVAVSRAARVREVAATEAAVDSLALEVAAATGVAAAAADEARAWCGIGNVHLPHAAGSATSAFHVGCSRSATRQNVGVA
jgi:hypothetical protein